MAIEPAPREGNGKTLQFTRRTHEYGTLGLLLAVGAFYLVPSLPGTPRALSISCMDFRQGVYGRRC